MLNKRLMLALYKIISAVSNKKLVAWDFPPTILKKVFFALKKFLAEKNIPITQPEGLKGEYADWPHFSIAFIPKNASKEDLNKIKLAGPIYAITLKTGKVKIVPGGVDPSVCFIIWELHPSDPLKIKKFKTFIYELINAEMPKQDYAPHVSIAVADVKYLDQLQDMADDINNFFKQNRFATSYVPEQLHIWENFKIVDIESLDFK
jgi:hypothetical protein